MSTFAESLLRWYRHHGRFDLPWQQDRSLYRTWVAEIMLQQTRVTTVLPYFERFIERFPDCHSLARASLDNVLLLWAGLGYYSRARNLHKAATLVVENHQAMFPSEYEKVLALPGIGPSTAGAILAQALGKRHTILDGNVKRVLARYHAIAGWPGQPAVEKQLWQWAECYTPEQNVADYTQAIMDLGATVCTRSAAKCESCPLMADCTAYQQGRVSELPAKKPRRVLPVRKTRLLIIRNDKGQYLMQKRPPAGIWGGLWSLPELAMEQQVADAVKQNWQLIVSSYRDLPVFRHTFSHFHLDIMPCEVDITSHAETVADNAAYQWQADITQLALAAPVSIILQAS
jgi:A/G-specific adenine glycosylase